MPSLTMTLKAGLGTVDTEFPLVDVQNALNPNNIVSEMANDAFAALAHPTRREIVERLYIATGVPQAPDDVSSKRTGAGGDHPDAKPIAKRTVKARVANDHRSPVMASFFSPENYTADV